MNAIRHIIIASAALLLLPFASLTGQQMPVYSQYEVNPFIVNPAMVGLDGTVRISLSIHDYLIGMQNGPMTFTLAGSGRILKSKGYSPVTDMVPASSGHVGLGGLIFSDNNGMVKRIGGQFTYGYHIDLNSTRTSMLSFGLSAMLSQTRIDIAQLEFNEDEPLLNEGFNNAAYAPDAMLGVMFRHRQHYIGLTVSNIFQRTLRFGELDYDFVLYRHYFLLAGTSFRLTDKWLFSPSMLAKYASNRAYQVELAARIDYKRALWLSVAYRSPGTASIVVGLSKGSISIGYDYEYNFSDLRSFKGAQEFVILCRFGDPNKRGKRR